MEIEATLVGGLIQFHDQRVSLGESIVSNACNLPRDFHAGGAAGDAELMIRHLLRDVQVGRRGANGRELIAVVAIQGLEPCGKVNAGGATPVESDVASVNVH